MKKQLLIKIKSLKKPGFWVLFIILFTSCLLNIPQAKAQSYSHQLGYNTNNQYAVMPSSANTRYQPIAYPTAPTIIPASQPQIVPMVIQGQKVAPYNNLPKYGKSQSNNLSQRELVNSIAEGGFYFGLGVGFGGAMGEITSDTCPDYGQGVGNCGAPDEEDGFLFGSSGGGDGLGDATGISLLMGAPVSKNLRIEVSFGMYSGLNYGENAFYDSIGDGIDINELPVIEGGDIESNVLMASFYYNFDGLFGGSLGLGNFKPYIGLGIGYAFNTIKDYVIKDDAGFKEECPQGDPNCILYYGENPVDDIFVYEDYYYDGYNTYFGSTNKSLAWMFSVGITFPFSDNAHFDLSYKRLSLGEVKTSGNMYMDYGHFFVTNSPYTDSATYSEEYQGFINNDVDLQELKDDYFESGDITINEFGGAVRVYF
jgi:hypothetical protein